MIPQEIRMRIASVIAPMSDHHLKLAAQIGVTDVVGRYPGPQLSELIRLRDRVASFGMKLSVIEGYIPHDLLVHGKAGRDAQLANFNQLLRNMAEAGVEICCYNFMPADDWARTSVRTVERGGALVTAFDLSQTKQPAGVTGLTAARMWDNLRYFLEGVVPVAESVGVKLALHPDDPPVSPFNGHEQILTSVDAFERVVAMVPSPANGVCLCQGVFSQLGVDIPAAIRKLGKHIHYVHFRDTIGTADNFRETFHDNGKTDLPAVMRAYNDIGYTGPARPDHVPTLDGEAIADSLGFTLPPNEQITADTFNSATATPMAGYTMLGRLYAVGYMRGLIDATWGKPATL